MPGKRISSYQIAECFVTGLVCNGVGLGCPGDLGTAMTGGTEALEGAGPEVLALSALLVCDSSRPHSG